MNKLQNYDKLLKVVSSVYVSCCVNIDLKCQTTGYCLEIRDMIERSLPKDIIDGLSEADVIVNTADVGGMYRKFKREDAISFLLGAADYFKNSPDNGEDRAIWANRANAERCYLSAKLLGYDGEVSLG